MTQRPLAQCSKTAQKPFAEVGRTSRATRTPANDSGARNGPSWANTTQTTDEHRGPERPKPRRLRSWWSEAAENGDRDDGGWQDGSRPGFCFYRNWTVSPGVGGYNVFEGGSARPEATLLSQHAAKMYVEERVATGE